MTTFLAPSGVRWQLWLPVLGGLGALVYVAYILTPGPVPADDPDDKPAVVAKKRTAHTDWGASSYRGRAPLRQRAKARSTHQLLKAPPRRIPDGGAGNEVVPEKSSNEKHLKPKKMGVLQGKVVALPSKKTIKSFTVVYARSKRGGRWFGGANKEKKNKDGFPVGAVKKSKQISDAKGEFNLKLEVGAYVVQIKAKGFESGNPTFSYASTRTWRRRTFGLLRAGTGSIVGKVVGRKSKPVPGADVIALISGGSRWGWRRVAMGRGETSSSRKTKTNSEGEFQIGRLPAGGYGVVIRAKGYVAWRQRGIRLAPGEIKDLGMVRLNGNTGSITGFVYGPGEKPLSGVSVGGFSRGKNGRTARFMRTDTSGAFKLDDLPAGDVMLFARKGRGFSGARRTKNVKLKVGQTLKHIFRFGVGGFTLKGKVTTADGTPIQDAKVLARPSTGRFRWRGSSGTGTTDEKGEYSIAGLKEGLHVVTVTMKGKPSPGGAITIKNAETIHNIQLQGGQLELSFTDSRTKKPLKVAVFSMLTWKGDGSQRLMQSGKAGQPILYKNLPNVPLNLRIFTSGYSTLVKSGLYAGQSGKLAKLNIALEPAGTFQLTIKTPDKKIPERAWVRMLIENKYQWVPSTATSGGELLVRSLPPGTVHLQIHATGYNPLKVTVDVPAKGTGTGSFFLTPKPKTPSKSNNNNSPTNHP